MKVLVATRETQGVRANDFCNADEGELVVAGIGHCDGETIDGSCGCLRSFIGLVTGKATTTFKIVERPDLPYEALEALILRAFGASGWAKSFGGDDILDTARHRANDVRELGEMWPIGTVLERRGDMVGAR